MRFSRRNFLKAAGSGVALTAIQGQSPVSAMAAPPLLPSAVSKEKATFIINGKPLVAEYEARTTLWEVIAMKFGMTGTNQSCNRASCGACTIPNHRTPFYSCHTLAMKALRKKISTRERMGDKKTMH